MKNKINFRRDKRGLGFRCAERLIKSAVNTALKAEMIHDPCELSVLLTDDNGMRRLNCEFRNVDSSTDVLSFPANEFEAGSFDVVNSEINRRTGRALLGDMALSLEHAAAQGIEYGHGTSREIQYLTVHSVLHLLGYDHTDEGEKKRQMRAREKRIMSIIEGTREK